MEGCICGEFESSTLVKRSQHRNLQHLSHKNVIEQVADILLNQLGQAINATGEQTHPKRVWHYSTKAVRHTRLNQAAYSV